MKRTSREAFKAKFGELMSLNFFKALLGYAPTLPAASALTGSEVVAVAQGGAGKRTTTQDIAALAESGAGYLSYVALLSQSGTDAPVATVLENTLGITPTYTYEDVGDYRLRATGVFPPNKTAVIGVLMSSNSTVAAIAQLNNADSVLLRAFDTGEQSDDFMVNFLVEVRVYP